MVVWRKALPGSKVAVSIFCITNMTGTGVAIRWLCPTLQQVYGHFTTGCKLGGLCYDQFLTRLLIFVVMRLALCIIW